MMRIDIAICDDEQKSLQMIQKELYHIADKLKIEIETYAYKEGKKVLDLIYNEKEDFDVLFLDIDMPDVSGLEVAKKLRQKHLDIILIFISAYEQYVFESIEYFAESTEAFPLGTRMTLGKRRIRRKSRNAWCSSLKSLRAYGKIFFIGTVPSDLRQTAYRQAAFSFIHWLE